MQFQIPQFIERETKVVGPLTFRQFAYLAIPGSAAMFLYFTVPFSTFLLAALFLEAIGAALAFMKVGGRSLPEIMLNALKFTVSPKTYLWEKRKTTKKADAAVYAPQPLKQGEIPTKVQLTRESKVESLATQIVSQK